MTLVRFILASTLLAVACGGGGSGKLPVDHPIYEHKAPEDLVGDDGDGDDDDDDDGDEDGGEA
jgi:hypothetical protein